MDRDLHQEFLIGRSQEFGPDRCFICGVHIPVGSEERTGEHVFPKWLLRELDLWNKAVVQVNGELLSYRRLTVPCCQRCNGTDLSEVEKRVKEAFREGLQGLEQMDRRDLFLWLGKIYYGLVYRESLQPRFVRQQQGERLVPVQHLRSVSFHHFLLQALAGLVDWVPEAPGPASFHFFECLDDEDPGRRFDYMDDLFIPMLGIRMGQIGIVCVLQDWGRSEGVQQPHLQAARAMRLHPTQFREVYGRLNYMTRVSWRNKVHAIVGGTAKATVLAGSRDDFSGSFVVEEFAQVMASLWEVPKDAIYKDGFTYSTICDMSGVRNSVADHDVVFVAPHGQSGLWPAHRVDLCVFSPEPDE